MTLSLDNNDTRVLSARYPGETSTLSQARRDVVGFLRQHDVEDHEIERVQLLVTELATNAIRASPGRDYSVRVALQASVLEVQVCNDHPEESLPPRSDWHPVSELSPRGRGLMIVRSLADHIAVAEDDDKVAITAHLHRD